MHATHLANLFANRTRPFVLVLGTNEIASAVASRLVREEFLVVMSYDPSPPVIRRGMAYHDALFDDPAVIEGVEGVRADSTIEIAMALARPNTVAVTMRQLTDIITSRTPNVVIDARMQKYELTPDLRGLAHLVIGLGPRFSVGLNCDVAIETHPANQGAVVASGQTLSADHIVPVLGGVGKKRFHYSERAGIWRTSMDIGMRVFKGLLLGHHDGVAIHAALDGVLRGVARDGTHVNPRMKLIEIDPRRRHAQWTGMDERGRQISEATLSVIRQRLTRHASFVPIDPERALGL